MEEESLPLEASEGEEEDKEKSISSDLIRGHINTIILRALYDGDKYGYEIISEIERKSKGQYSLKQPSLYSALKRLEKDGYITSYWGGSVSGGRRKYFSLTDEGKAISEQNQAEWEYSRTIIDSLISDRDFDFSNPAPTAVDMRVLKRSTSRVPGREDEEESEEPFTPIYDDTAEREKLNAEFEQKNAALAEEFEKKTGDLQADYDRRVSELEAQYSEKTEALNSSFEQKSSELEALYTQRNSELEEEYSRKSSELEADRARFDDEKELRAAEAKAEREAYEEAFRAQSEAHQNALLAQKEAVDEELRSKLQEAQNELAYRDRVIEEERKHIDDIRAAQEEETAARNSLQKALAERDSCIEQERADHAAELGKERARAQSALLEAENRHQREMQEREAALRSQLEEQFRLRQQELIRQNYLSLVTAPPLAEAQNESGFGYAAAVETTPPSARPAPREEPVHEPTDYKPVVHQIYAGAANPARESAPRARSIDGIDFNDLETRAAQDHIRLVTSGGTAAPKDAEPDRNIVHKGKALFLSAIVAFFYCIALGAVVMALKNKLALPLFFPYFIWGAGLALLLVTGLAYANHFGERTLRHSGPALINAIVVYVLLVIVTLIVALSVRIDFANISELSTYVIIPAVFFVAELLFGIVYYILLRPAK